MIEWKNADEEKPDSDEIMCVIWHPGFHDYYFAFWIDGAGTWDSPDRGFINEVHGIKYAELPECPID